MYELFSNFGLNIYDFSQPAEIFTVFVPSLYNISALLLMLAIIALIIIGRKITYLSRLRKRKISNFSRMRKTIRVLQTWLIRGLLLYFISIVILEWIIQIIPSNINFFYALLKLFTFVMDIAFSTFMVLAILFFISIRFFLEHIKLLFASISLFFIIYCVRVLASFNVWLIRNEENESIKKYEFISRNIQTSDTIRLIGSTNEYIFFDSLDNEKGKVIIFKKSDLINTITVFHQKRVFLWERKRYPPHEH
jgi:hypothetical protein